MKKVSQQGARRTGKIISVFLAVLMILGLTGAAAEDGHTLPEDAGAVIEQTADGEPKDTAIPAEDPAPAPAETPESSETPSDGQNSASAAAAEETVEISGVLPIGSVYQTVLREKQTLSLTIPAKTDLQLLTGGVPVKVRVVNAVSGWQWSARTSATGDAARPERAALITLDKGEYFVELEPLRAGRVSVCFAKAPRPRGGSDDTADSPGEKTDERAGADDASAEDREEEPKAAQDGADADQEASAGPETSQTAALDEKTDGAAEDAAEPEKGDEAGEDPAQESVLPEDAEKAEGLSAQDDAAARQPLTVTVTVSCDGPFEPGALITLRARVSDENYQGAVLWQYSADGGATVCDVEGAEGPEYSFFLDEINRTYWWRAYLK